MPVVRRKALTLRQSTSAEAANVRIESTGKENSQAASNGSQESSIGATLKAFVKNPLEIWGIGSPSSASSPKQAESFAPDHMRRKSVMFSPHKLESAVSQPNVVAITPRSILKKPSNNSLLDSTVPTNPNVDDHISSQQSTEIIPSTITKLIHPDLDDGDRTDAYTFLSTKIRSYTETQQAEFISPHAVELIKSLRVDISGTRTRSAPLDEKLVSAALKCLGYISYHEHLVAAFSDKDLSDTLLLLLNRFADPNLPKNVVNLIIWNLAMQRFPQRIIKPYVLRLLNAFVQGLKNNFKSVTIQSESLGGIYNLLKYSPAETCKEAKTWVGPLLKCLISKTTALRYKALQLCSNSLETIVGPHGHHVHAAVVKFMREPTGEGQRHMDVWEKYMLDTVQSDDEPKYGVQLWSALVTWHGNNLHNPTSDIKLFLSIIEVCFNRPMTVCAAHRAWVRLAHAFARKDNGNFLVNTKRLRLLRQPIQSALNLEQDEAGNYSIQPGKAKIRLAAAVGALAVAYACMSPCVSPTIASNKDAWVKMDMVWEEFLKPTLTLLLLPARPGSSPPSSSDPPLPSSSPVSSTDSTSSSMSEEARKSAARAANISNAPRQLGLRLLAALLLDTTPLEWKVDRIVLSPLAPPGIDMTIVHGGEELIVAPEEIAHLDPRWVRMHCRELLAMIPAGSDLTAFSNLLKSLHSINQKEIQPSLEASQAIQEVCYFVSKVWKATLNNEVWLQFTNAAVRILGNKTLSGKKLKWDLDNSTAGSMTPIIYLANCVISSHANDKDMVAEIVRLGTSGSQQSAWEYLTSLTKLVNAKLSKGELTAQSWLLWWYECSNGVNSLLEKVIKEELDINPFRGIVSDTAEKHPHEEKQWVVFELLGGHMLRAPDVDSDTMHIWKRLLCQAQDAAHLHHRDTNVVIDELARRMLPNIEGNITRTMCEAVAVILDSIRVLVGAVTKSEAKQHDSFTNPVPHLCDLVSQLFSLASLDVVESLLKATSEFLKRIAQPYSRPIALAIRKAISRLVAPDTGGQTSKELFSLWQSYLAAAIASAPAELTNSDLQELEDVLVIGLKSHMTDVVNHTLTVWNETFGLLAQIDYPPNLKKVFTQVEKTAIIKLPSWQTSSYQSHAKDSPAISDTVPSKQVQVQLVQEPLSRSVASQEIERNVDDEFRSQMPSRKRKVRITAGQMSPSTSSAPTDGDAVPETAKAVGAVNATRGPQRRRTSSFVPATSPRKSRRKSVVNNRHDSRAVYTVIPKKTKDSPPRLDTIRVEQSDEEVSGRPFKKRRPRNMPKLYSALDDSQPQDPLDGGEIDAAISNQDETPSNINKDEKRRVRKASMQEPVMEYESPVLETPRLIQPDHSEKRVPDSTNLDRFAAEASFGVSLGDPPSDEIGEPDSPSRIQLKRRRMSLSQPPVSADKADIRPRQELSEPPTSPRRSPRRSLMPEMIASDDSDAPRGAFARRISLIPKLIPSSMPEEDMYTKQTDMSIIQEDSREIISDTQMEIDTFMQDARTLAERGDVLAKMDARQLHMLQLTLNELWGGVVTAMGDRMGVKL